LKVLAIDTSTVMASCALLDEENLLGEFSLNQNMGHSENLVPMVKTLLDNLNLKVSDIDLYGVALGPGSFTGLRIGIATVKAFAHVYNKPIVGVSTLEGLAFNVRASGVIVPMIDARKNRVYTGIYKWEDGYLNNVEEPTVMEIDELLEHLKENYNNIIVNGNGIYTHREKIKDKLGDRVEFAPFIQNTCRAASIGELALLKREEGKLESYFSLVPEYIRQSQAQRDYNKERKG
jgi:tRNA threonylcarbamoyladenosine biosynthesis protein TsaB